jgi:hypothetical protein
MTGFEGKLNWEVLQARWILGGIEPQEFVDLAIYALQQGFDGPALQQIAGLSNPTSRDLGKLPEKVFTHMGLKSIDHDGAAALLAARGEASTNHAIRTILETFPHFAKRWEKQIISWRGISGGPYSAMTAFVHFVIEDVYEKGKLDETRRVFEHLEKLLVGADEENRNLIGFGFFETLQNVASWRPGGNKVYEQFFGPISKQIWSELQRMWAGKSSLMDVIRAEQKTRDPQ